MSDDKPAQIKEDASGEQAGQGDAATVFYMLKTIMGAGGFALPWAFKRMGLAAGVSSTLLCAFASCLTLRQIAVLRSTVHTRLGLRCSTYVDLAHATLGEAGAAVVYLLVVVCSLGVCSAYIVFIASTLRSMHVAVASGPLSLATAALLLPLVCYADVSILSALAQAGTAAVLLGYVVTICYALMDTCAPTAALDASSIADPSLLAPADWASAVAGFGPIAFLFLIHFLSVPIMGAAQASARPGGFERLAQMAFGSAAAINACFGALCLVCFRGRVSSIVVNDIAAGTWWLGVTKLLLCADLFCSYPLVFAAGRQIVERSVRLHVIGFALPEAGGKTGDSAAAPSWQCAVRAVLLLVTVAVAQLHDFGAIISLVGGFAQVIMAFVLPPLMLMQVEGPSMPYPHQLANAALALLGAALALLVTGTSLASAVHGEGS